MNVFIIAEIAQAHDGSIGIAHSYIDAISKLDVDSIKFQTHIGDAESSIHEPFRVNFSYVDDTRIDYWRRIEFSLDQWRELKKHCDEREIEFISSPFSNAAVNLLEKVGVNKYKIGSGEMTNFLLLEKVAKTKKEIILSSGMSNFSEIDGAIDFLSDFGNKLSLLQCTTKYPTPLEEIGLNVLKEFKKKYKMPIGLSDHSGSIFPSIAAVALGATIIEVHVTFDKQMFGPDATSSLTIGELKHLVSGIRTTEKAIGNCIDKNDLGKFRTLKSIFEKSLSVNKDLGIGHALTFDDLEAKKPKDFRIPASQYRKVIGMKLKNRKNKYEFLNIEDLSL